MKLTVFRHEREAAAVLADRIAAEVAANPALVLGLATGRTPVPLYQRLVDLYRRRGIDFSRVTTFNLDEFWGLGPDHPGSYRAYMQRHLFAHVNIDPARVHFLNGLAPDAERECARYERAIAEAGGIDLQVLGIGGNGHIGFNEPAGALNARTHLAVLKPQTRRANASFFGNDASRVPADALSMGMATILQSRTVVLVAMGRGKRRAVERMVHGPLTTRVPASFLQLHPQVEVLLDEAAAESVTLSALSVTAANP
ncbi:MAG: glucosamine-6-phosphate deaminase [Vicinamibacteraceae bacterium]|nr:glucosamine-6-phosphate deaminase [Vicinamibacteraceae bacterium]